MFVQFDKYPVRVEWSFDMFDCYFSFPYFEYYTVRSKKELFKER